MSIPEPAADSRPAPHPDVRPGATIGDGGAARGSAAEAAAIDAQAWLHHQYLLGLQLMVATREGPEVIGEWMFRLFRRQHLEKFLSSFDKLGLTGLPHAVACARYHVLSNAIGGVAVEYHEESRRKAWVRFRYPRWMFDGATLCGLPVEASRGFLRGWYAHNGVSLGNPRLGFVCISEDMTGEFGLCGYFFEHDRELSEQERLRFARDEMPPRFDAAAQPRPPQADWNPERLARAARNYSVEYIRNGLAELAEVVGAPRARALGGHAARLIGMQSWRETARRVGACDGGVQAAADYLMRMFAGMGDSVARSPGLPANIAVIEQRAPRVLRGLCGAARESVRDCWTQLWVGALRAHREPSALAVQWRDGDLVRWTVSEARDRQAIPGSAI